MVFAVVHTTAQTTQQAASPQTTKAPARADILRGEYGPDRANNDLLFYHLDVRVDPEKKLLSGKTTIRFRMLKDDTRIQIDLQRPMEVEKILLVGARSNEQVVAFFNRGTGTDLTAVFNQYLRHAAIPILELKFNEARGEVSYRWKVDEPNFAMPIRVGEKERWQIIRPTTAWQTMKSLLKKSEFAVATDLYFVDVSKL